jgi:hypothetical protein
MRTLALSSQQSSRTTQRAAIVFSIRRAHPALCAALLLVSGLPGLAQDSTDLVDKAPPPIDEALRARVDQYYQAFIAGKFKDAYLLVADDSQDAFFGASKAQYKSCETIKIRYSDNFTKATVVESCKADWRFEGRVALTTFPVASTWKIVDGKWFWFYVKPTQMPFPFSPTGFIPVPSADAPPKDAPVIPDDLKGAARSILAKVSVDKQTVHLRPDESSQDVIHVHNAMPGVIKLQLDPLAMPGLKITLAKTELAANEETTVSFEYKRDDPGVACAGCTERIPENKVVALRVIPTGQTFSISLMFGPPAPAPVQQQSPAPKP